MIVFSFSPTLCCSLFKNTCRPTFLHFSLSFFCTPTLLWCICLLYCQRTLIIHMVIFKRPLSLILASVGAGGGLVGAVGLDQLTGLPSHCLGESASGYCWAGHSCRSTGAIARSGVGCEGKIEKSIMRATKKRKEGLRQKEMKSFKKTSHRALLINNIRGRPPHLPFFWNFSVAY